MRSVAGNTRGIVVVYAYPLCETVRSGMVQRSWLLILYFRAAWTMILFGRTKKYLAVREGPSDWQDGCNCN